MQREVDPLTTNNPWFSARRKWDSHVGDAVSSRLMWQVIALIACLGWLTTGTYYAGKDTAPPQFHVVEVDKLGNQQAVELSETLATADYRVFEASVMGWVKQIREVTTDTTRQRLLIDGVWARLTEGDPAYAKYPAQYDHPSPLYPFTRAQRETVEVSIDSVLKQTEETWQVDWTETVYDRDGRLKERFDMRGLFQLYKGAEQLTDEKARAVNPLGIYVRDFSWGRVEERKVHQ